MVLLYSLFVRHHHLPPSRVFFFTYGNTINSCCVQKGIFSFVRIFFHQKKTFLKKRLILINCTDLDSDWLRTDDDHGTKGGIASPIVDLWKINLVVKRNLIQISW